jgi:regulatory protein
VNIFKGKPKHITFEEALAKAQKYCAYQERCSMEVKRKLFTWGLNEHQIGEIISRLESENFLSDKRFTELYVRSKVNQKKWGKLKIEAELRSRNISSATIEEQLAKIDNDVYDANIHQLINNKIKELEGSEPIKIQQKLNQYLLSKGYETEIIIRFLKQSLNKGT